LGGLHDQAISQTVRLVGFRARNPSAGSLGRSLQTPENSRPMAECLATLQELLPGASAVALAIASGAGGSALLELYYKPRRDCRKAATLLAGELSLNGELILFMREFHKVKPKQIPRDVCFSTVAWQLASTMIAELPAGMLKRVLLLYSRFDDLNEAVTHYGETWKELQVLPDGSPRLPLLTRQLDTIVDAFRMSLDNALDDIRALQPELLRVAKIPKRLRKAPAGDYEARVKNFLSERENRLTAMRLMPETEWDG